MSALQQAERRWENVLVEHDEGIAWVTLNRPAKRNAMSPALNREMVEVLDMLETDERCRVVVLTGAGDSFSAGMDLKEYFRETDQLAPAARYRVYRDAGTWQWRRLRLYPKATIAMVNGWCFGGAFTPLIKLCGRWQFRQLQTVRDAPLQVPHAFQCIHPEPLSHCLVLLRACTAALVFI